ncbi:hypothetical protein, partial [Bacillus cereus]|uniref:hypothetical protein n=1 Tax=Bacillus cereus TaxID=1396 RepID=UPI0020BD8F15
FMYLANSLAVAGISILFSYHLGTSLESASLLNYIHAFTISLIVIGLFSMIAYMILSHYHKMILRIKINQQ